MIRNRVRILRHLHILVVDPCEHKNVDDLISREFKDNSFWFIQVHISGIVYLAILPYFNIQ